MRRGQSTADADAEDQGDECESIRDRDGTMIKTPMVPVEPSTHRAGESDTDLLWDDVSDRIERFVQAWESGTPPALADFLPQPGAASRPCTLVELIKVDLEYRFRGETVRKSLDDYCQEFPELCADGELPIDLIYEELHLRQSLDPNLDLNRHLAAYPKHNSELRRMLAVSDPNATTSLGRIAARPNIAAGQRIDDFDLLALLGQGAFASVFIARQLSMQRIVAVKISADRGVEPQTLARLDHPNIVRIYDQRILADRGLRLLYMQFVPGGTLREMLDTMARGGPLEQRTGRALLAAIDQRLDAQGVPPAYDSVNRRRLAALPWHQAVCQLCLQLAEAMHYAHGQGVLHRDIKPANILISDSASPKLVDFNISSCSKVEGASATAYFGGSLAYMSPEQMEACSPRYELTADSLGPPADIYSLGIVIWEMLVGTRPFSDPAPQKGWASTLDALIQQRRQGVDTAQWTRLATHAPPGLTAVLRRCLDPDPQQRFQSAADLADQLLICQHPQAQELLVAPQRWIPRFMYRWPEVSIILISVIPNALAAIFNFRFNFVTMIEPLGDAAPFFKRVVLAINLTVFPLGIVYGWWLVRKEAAEVRRRAKFGATESAPRALRRRCLRLGRYVAVLGIVLWTISGLIYPIAMAAAGHPLRGPFAIQFFFSLVAGGVVGAAYPFFGVTAMVTEVWYPALIRPHSVSTTDVPQFRWVERVSARYLVLAAAIPMFSLGVLALSGQTDKPGILVGLSLGGLALFWLVFLTWRRLHKTFGVYTELARAKAPAQIQLESANSDEFRL